MFRRVIERTTQQGLPTCESKRGYEFIFDKLVGSAVTRRGGVFIRISGSHISKPVSWPPPRALLQDFRGDTLIVSTENRCVAFRAPGYRRPNRGDLPERSQRR